MCARAHMRAYDPVHAYRCAQVCAGVCHRMYGALVHYSALKVCVDVTPDYAHAWYLYARVVCLLLEWL